ncbi:MAG: halocyanin domain-containing protein [Haloferacaceae archaeon]
MSLDRRTFLALTASLGGPALAGCLEAGARRPSGPAPNATPDGDSSGPSGPYRDPDRMPYGDPDQIPYGDPDQMPYGDPDRMPYGDPDRMPHHDGQMPHSGQGYGDGPGGTGPQGTDGSDTAQNGGEQSLASWFDDVGNYEGVVDRRGERGVTVRVGTRGNGGAFAYDPPAVRVSPGTTVTWEWTGAGGYHDVAAVDGSFGSDLLGEAGAAFAATFASAGSYRYYCTPHRGLGMKGAVVVE